jgi:hypothetical protein
MQHPRHSLKRLEIGGLPALELERMTTHFYTAFLNDTLDKFIGSYDDPHADRFATIDGLIRS